MLAFSAMKRFSMGLVQGALLGRRVRSAHDTVEVEPAAGREGGEARRAGGWVRRERIERGALRRGGARAGRGR